jgi:hypothetical protein
MTTIDSGIQKLLDNYFDLMHLQNMENFDEVFHKVCNLYGVVDGELNIRSFDVYREAVAGRQSPAEVGNARRDKVIMVDQISPTLALAKVQLEMFGGVMQDYLNLSFVDGQWFIVSKMWERVGDSA